jgi:chromosomal replication initiation ATPase DnaA
MRKITEPTPQIVFDVIEIVALEFGVTAEDILGKIKTDKLVQPRHTAMHLLYNHIFKQEVKPIRIARWFKRDATSGIIALKNVNNWLQIYPEYAEKYNLLKTKIEQL